MATSTKHQDKLELLRDILLPEEHKALEQLSERILRMEKQELQQNELIRKLDAELSRKMEEVKKETEESLRGQVLKVLKTEIEKDPATVAAIFAPLTSALLEKEKAERKKEKRERRSAPARNLSRGWKNFTGLFRSASSTKKAEKQLKSAVIVQTLVIDRKSGNLKASFQENDIVDDSKISVICGVINDHIQKHDLGQDQHLTILPYGPYQIYVQGFIKHFVALVITGRKEMDCKEKMQDIIFSFYYEYMSKNLDLLNEGKHDQTPKKIISRTSLEKAMDKYFGAGASPI